MCRVIAEDVRKAVADLREKPGGPQCGGCAHNNKIYAQLYGKFLRLLAARQADEQNMRLLKQFMLDHLRKWPTVDAAVKTGKAVNFVFAAQGAGGRIEIVI